MSLGIWKFQSVFLVKYLPLQGLFSPGWYPDTPVQLQVYDPAVLIHCPGQSYESEEHSSISINKNWVSKRFKRQTNIELSTGIQMYRINTTVTIIYHKPLSLFLFWGFFWDRIFQISIVYSCRQIYPLSK